MKKLVLIFILCTAQLSAQKEANFWYFGENAGLNFSTEPPTAILDGALNTFEGCSSISDKNGKLLFYSDGLSVWNKQNKFMQFSNGTHASGNLLGNPSSTQSGLIVPKPNSTSIYYLFTVDDGPAFSNGVIIENGKGLNFYTIDMSKNGGLGEIVSGPVNLSFGNENLWSEKVTAVAGEECNTVWLISASSDNYYAFKIDENGINTSNPVLTAISPRSNRRGYLKISPDAKKLVEANQGNNSLSRIYDFNNSTGEITNERILNIPENSYGVAFSPSSNKLYISTGVFGQFLRNGQRNPPSKASIFQLDISSNNIANINGSVKEIYTNSGYRGALQLASNGKIYYARSNTSYLGVINFPESDGNAVDFREEGIFLETGFSTEGLPPFIQSFFATVNLIDKNEPSQIVSNMLQEICAENQLDITPDIPQNLTNASFSWKKVGNDSIKFTTKEVSIDKNLGNGVYLFSATATDQCNRVQTYSGSVEVVFVDAPKIQSIPVVTQCDVDNNPNDFKTAFNLRGLESQIYSGTNNVTIEFFEENDLSFSSPLTKANYVNAQPTRSTNHRLVVKVTNTNGPKCFVTETIELKVTPSGLANYDNFFIAEYDSSTNSANRIKSERTGTAIVNFNDKTTEIINASNGALNTATYNFDYYLSAADAALQINEITPPFDKFYKDGSLIFVRISLKKSGSCESIGQFRIVLNELPEPQGNEIPIFLCVNNPIDVPQPFTVVLDASTNNTSDTYKWFLDGVEILNQNNASLNANKEGIYKVEAFRSFENNPSNTNDNIITKGFNTFTVVESNPPVITNVSFNTNKNNQNENTITVVVEGKGDYEYAINSTNLADFVQGPDNLTFTFTNISPGINQIFIRDKNNCGMIAASEPIPILNFQKFFTPNNDGNFDTWEVLGANNDFYQSVNYRIFNRFGKLLVNNNQKIHGGWNGYFNGQPLPQDDYWYTVTLVDITGKLTQKTGHFSLIRE